MKRLMLIISLCVHELILAILFAGAYIRYEIDGLQRGNVFRSISEYIPYGPIIFFIIMFLVSLLVIFMKDKKEYMEEEKE